MMLQPLLHVLFGTEEVVDASPTAQEHPGSGGVEFRHLPLIYQYVNRRAGVLGGIVDRHFLVQILRVDQREKVDGSIGIELLQPVNVHSVGHERDAHPTFPVNVAGLRHSVGHPTGSRVSI